MPPRSKPEGKAAAIAAAGLLCILASYAYPLTPFVDEFAGTIRVPIGGGTLFSPAALDIEGDGDIDYAVAHYDLKMIAIVKNDSTGAFDLSGFASLGPENSGNPVYLVASDMDNDGDRDLVVLTQNPTGAAGPANSVTLLKNTAGEFAYHSSLEVGRSPRMVRIADVNLDGFYDYAVPNQGDDTVTLAYNLGDGAPGSLAIGGSIRVLTSPGAPVSIAVERADQGDLPDICVASYGGNKIQVHLQGNGGTFLPPVSSVSDSPSSIVARDINGDGRAELFVSNTFASTITIMREVGGGKFEIVETHDVGTFPGEMRFGLSDRDPRPDLLVYNERDATMTVLRANHKSSSGGLFRKVLTADVGEVNGFTLNGDADDDGRMDLATAESSGDLVIYKNGSLTQSERVSHLLGDPPFSPSGAIQDDVHKAIRTVNILIELSLYDDLADCADLLAELAELEE